MITSLDNLKDFTVRQIMTDGHLEQCRFSHRLVEILAKATRNENLEISRELSGFDDDGDFFMPAHSEHVPVTQWCETEDCNEPYYWSIFMFRDPITESSRVVGLRSDGSANFYLVRII